MAIPPGTTTTITTATTTVAAATTTAVEATTTVGAARGAVITARSPGFRAVRSRRVTEVPSPRRSRRPKRYPMRSNDRSGRTHLARSRTLAWAVTLCSLISTVATGCSRPPVSITTPSSLPVSDLPSPAPSMPGAMVMARSKPVRVRIPAIGVDSKLMDLSLDGNGRMTVPPDGAEAGWYTGAPTPGELGPAIIAGHVDWGGRQGVFYHLRNLRPDDRVTVTRLDGSTAVFRVMRVDEFPKNKFPTQTVYADIGYAGLRLITCGGSFDRLAHSYNDNIVVFAKLVRT